MRSVLFVSAAASSTWEPKAARCPFSTVMEVTEEGSTTRFGATYETHSYWYRSRPVSFASADLCARELGLMDSDTGLALDLSAAPDDTGLPHAIFRLRAYETEGSNNRCYHAVSVPRDGRVHRVVVPFRAFECKHMRVGGKDPVANFLSARTIHYVGIQMAFGAEGGSEFTLHGLSGTAEAKDAAPAAPRCCATEACRACHAAAALAATPSEFCRSFPDICELQYASALSAVTCSAVRAGDAAREAFKEFSASTNACADLTSGTEPAAPPTPDAVYAKDETLGAPAVETAAAAVAARPYAAFVQDGFDVDDAIEVGLGSFGSVAVLAAALAA